MTLLRLACAALVMKIQSELILGAHNEVSANSTSAMFGRLIFAFDTLNLSKSLL